MKAVAKRRPVARVVHCATCGQLFQPERSASRYCSDSCAVEGAKRARLARPLRVVHHCRRCGDALPELCRTCKSEVEHVEIDTRL